jgi:beta-mannosidase
MRRQSLATAWTLRALSDCPVGTSPVPATVPGCVHTDLLAAGLIDDPYIADNERRVQWIGRTAWEYTCRFSPDPEVLRQDRVELNFDGIDTLATVLLNGQPIGRAENMYHPHRFGTRSLLRPGENTLAVRFDAPVTSIEELEQKHGHLPYNVVGSSPARPFNQVRKLACNFGWDWGPDLATCGLWQPAHLEGWSGPRIAHVRPLVVYAGEDRASLDIRVDLDGADTLPDNATIEILSPDGRPVGFPNRNAHGWLATVVRPRLWWPVGHGDQPLYTLTVRVGEEVWTRKIGMRTSELRTTPDDAPSGPPIEGKVGESMTLLVNGKPIYLKGANWIPDDCFPHRVTRERYRARLTQARDANMNMLRVWGGGLYETEAFYELCDELGLLVWQDFLFACAFYSEAEPLWSNVEREARHNIARLSSHASLVIFNGCNENVMAANDWAGEWQTYKKEPKITWGLGYYLSLLPKLMAELAPTIPYWPASPWSGSFDRPANANEYGNRHIWDVWHGPGQYRNYLAHYPRMATEFGFHGPPTWPTLERSIPPSERRWDSGMMVHHNKNGATAYNGQQQCTTRMGDDFVPPTAPEQFDDWLYLAQVMQARALEMGVTWFRALHPWNSGALFWQLNDCWPVSSWSAIDGDGRRKPLCYAARRFFAPRIVTLKPAHLVTGTAPPTSLSAYLHNDTDEPWTTTLQVRRLTLEGRATATFDRPLSIPARSSSRIELPPEYAHADSNTFLVAQAEGGERGLWWFAPDKEMAYPPPLFDAEVSEWNQGQQTLRITATTLLRDLCVFPDRLHPEATVSDQLNTLLPGDSAEWVISTPVACSVAQLTSPPILACATSFGKKRA